MYSLVTTVTSWHLTNQQWPSAYYYSYYEKVEKVQKFPSILLRTWSKG